HGSANKACEQMGKNRTGMTKLYHSPQGASFRDAWHGAVALAKRRKAEAAAALDRPSPGTNPPTLDHRVKARHKPERELQPEPGEAEDDTGLRLELVERLVAKFQRKVGQERECRLAGRIVEADFYLRQITALEVAFDLMIDGHGDSGWEMLMQARRGTRNMLEIADTYMARVLDQARRDQWAAMAEPGRPEAWPERYLIGDATKVDARLEPQEATGRGTRPPPGYALNDWCHLDHDEQQRIWEALHRKDAEAQVAWEAEGASQSAEWRARQLPSPLEGEGDSRQARAG
ncbi:MAG TPA: hypothetical protein VFR60_00120, partial [Sphingomicrobium sp.]|nr:hypothetical protein [Sphingomicrobium sp.]